MADEPTASLDHAQVETVLRILRGLADHGRTADGEQTTHTVARPGDEFGEMGAVFDIQRAATARARTSASATPSPTSRHNSVAFVI